MVGIGWLTPLIWKICCKSPSMSLRCCASSRRFPGRTWTRRTKGAVMKYTKTYIERIAKLAIKYLSRRGPAEVHKRKLFLLAIVNVLVAGNIYAQVVAPTNLRTTSVTSSAVGLAWSITPTSWDYSIVVERSTNSLTSGFMDIKTLATNATSYTDTTIVSGKRYYYRVSSVARDNGR